LLQGRAGNDTLLGGQASDDLFGDTGDDKILDKLSALRSGKAGNSVKGTEFWNPKKEVISHFDPPP
jgi:Ca2+-binding RTX toxin-like protein